MGRHGLPARGGVKRLTAGRWGGGRRVLFVASIGLLPALAGCSSFSPSSASSNAAGPPNNSSAVAGQSAAPSGYSPAVATAAAPPSVPAYTPSAPAAAPDFGPGFANVNGTVFSAPPTEDTGPGGLLVALFKSNSAPPAQTAAVPSPPSTYAPSAPAAAPDFGPGFANVNGTVFSAPPTEDTGPSGLLVALFKPTSTPPAGSANMPHPPSTYTASAPPYTPPPAQPAAPAPPPTSSAQ